MKNYKIYDTPVGVLKAKANIFDENYVKIYIIINNKKYSKIVTLDSFQTLDKWIEENY